MINLLPPDIKTERTYGRRNRFLLTYGIMLLMTAFCTAAIMQVSLVFVGSDEDQLISEIETAKIQTLKLEKDQATIEKLAKQLSTADTLYLSSVRFSEVIPEIANLLPEGSILNALSLTGGNTDPLQLDVDIKNQELAAVLVQNLLASNLFEAADIAAINSKGASQDSDGSGDIYRFTTTVTASFKGSADAKQKAKAAEEAKAKKQEAVPAEGATQ